MSGVLLSPTNGYSLARKVLLEEMKLNLNDTPEELDQTLGEELLTPTRIYVKSILNLIRDFSIKGIAHITGGGLLENVPRVLPQKCKAVIDRHSWDKPAIFEMIRKGGNIPEEEMYRTFNYGIGMVLIIAAKDVDDVLNRLAGLKEKAYLIGEIASSKEPTVVLS